MKMLALERWTKPDNARELRGFLGLANYYSGYVQNYASIGTPLIYMWKNLPKHKNGKKIGLTWDALDNEAFLKLTQFEEDTYNVKKILGHRTQKEAALLKCDGKVTVKIGIPRSRLRVSYLPITRFGEIFCKPTSSPKPLTYSPTLVERSPKGHG